MLRTAREGRPKLAVVLIARNQAWNVSRLVESVRERSAGLTVELVLVDSASSDDTVRSARDLGVRVIELDGSRRLTAAGGRLAGQQGTDSDYILFLDGDMELVEGWVGPALAVLEGDGRVAGLAGQVMDQPLPSGVGGSGDHGSDVSVVAGPVHSTFAVPFIGGAALYRRSALDDVGSFDASLYSEEEPELGLRLRAAGYELRLSDQPMALHYTAPGDSLATIYARWRRNLYLGAGQTLRKHLGQPTLRTWLRERGFFAAPAAMLLLTLAAVLSWAVTGQSRWMLVWLLTVVVGVTALAWRRRSLNSALHTLLLRLAILDGTLRGFFLYPARTRGGAGW